MPVGTCPVCGNPCSLPDSPGAEMRVFCPLDGEFRIESSAADSQEWEKATAIDRRSFLDAAARRTAEGETVVIRPPLAG